MNIEHIEWQIIAALIYLMYVIVMLLGNRSAGQKRKTVLIGFTPGLLAGVVFVAQYVLEIAYIDTSIPITLAQVFDSFYANLFILILLTGIISVGYLVLQGNVIVFRDIINNERNSQLRLSTDRSLQ